MKSRMLSLWVALIIVGSLGSGCNAAPMPEARPTAPIATAAPTATPEPTVIPSPAPTEPPLSPPLSSPIPEALPPTPSPTNTPEKALVASPAAITPETEVRIIHDFFKTEALFGDATIGYSVDIEQYPGTNLPFFLQHAAEFQAIAKQADGNPQGYTFQGIELAPGYKFGQEEAKRQLVDPFVTALTVRYKFDLSQMANTLQLSTNFNPTSIPVGSHYVMCNAFLPSDPGNIKCTGKPPLFGPPSSLWQNCGPLSRMIVNIVTPAPKATATPKLQKLCSSGGLT